MALTRAAGLTALLAIAACSLTTSLEGFSSGEPDATSTTDGGDPDGGVAPVDGSPTEDREVPLDAVPDVQKDSPFDAGLMKLVFTTSTAYTGNLGGLQGADAKCQTLANNAGLVGTFRAWLSDGTTTAAARLTHATVRYVRIDNIVVANDWNGLTSGTLLAPISTTEVPNGTPPGAGVPPCGAKPIWTNTTASGAKHGDLDCYDWTDGTAGATGHSGNAAATSSGWTYTCDQSCATLAPIVCIQQ